MQRQRRAHTHADTEMKRDSGTSVQALRKCTDVCVSDFLCARNCVMACSIIIPALDEEAWETTRPPYDDCPPIESGMPLGFSSCIRKGNMRYSG
jgi:hypothetical protein